MQGYCFSPGKKTLQFSGADAAMHFPFDDIGLCYLDQPSIQQGGHGCDGENGGKIQDTCPVYEAISKV